jgi:hypothetical protein
MWGVRLAGGQMTSGVRLKAAALEIQYPTFLKGCHLNHLDGSIRRKFGATGEANDNRC